MEQQEDLPEVKLSRRHVGTRITYIRQAGTMCLTTSRFSKGRTGPRRGHTCRVNARKNSKVESACSMMSIRLPRLALNKLPCPLAGTDVLLYPTPPCVSKEEVGSCTKSSGTALRKAAAVRPMPANHHWGVVLGSTGRA